MISMTFSSILCFHFTLYADSFMVGSSSFSPAYFKGLSSTRQYDRNYLTCLSSTAQKNIFEMYEANEDNDDAAEFKKIVDNYLLAKFNDCHGDDCRMFCDKSEVEMLLKSVLPPVSKAELDGEVTKVLKTIGAGDDDLIEADSFLSAVVGNSFWTTAGPLVVKELIFLDCIYEFYFKEKRSILDNDDYDGLKEMLMWEGSSVVAMNAKEAQFVVSVATNKKGLGTLNDADYDNLKNELLAAQSWVVTTKFDPLEKMGIDTFLGYLHRSWA
eukprot:CAMPEP_0119033426 /NCGR_PEP_ID=MMETSP1177-20130426/466_1 /TAXON_ID=2985 /ORGANISM="Ochromonas sp, Strain CCMP1899" /LENGTH=269 /DNA_ID=CAMNT_0006990155 /DNA_START=167 /DNA_END=976 /DNA_ORIENTATION=+